MIYGFLHAEPSGVIAIDQTGGVKLAATRLYVYLEVETETLYLLTLGDKSTQKDDIKDCKSFVKQIKDDPDDGGIEDHENNEDDDEGDG